MKSCMENIYFENQKEGKNASYTKTLFHMLIIWNNVKIISMTIIYYARNIFLNQSKLDGMCKITKTF